MVPSVVSLQCIFHSKSTFWMVPFTCYGSQCCLALKCFLFKSVFLSKSTIWVVLFTLYGFQCCLVPVCFHTKSIFWVFPLTFHGSFVWFPVLFGSNMFLHSESTFWVVPFTFYGSQCCLAPKCCLLKLLNCWILTVRSCLDNIELGTGIFNHLGGVILFMHLFKSDSET